MSSITDPGKFIQCDPLFSHIPAVSQLNGNIELVQPIMKEMDLVNSVFHGIYCFTK
jgi:hypothetical protein